VNSLLVRPRLDIQISVPLRPPGARPELAYLGLGAGAFVAGAMAVGGSGALYRTSMALMGVIFCLALLYVRGLVRAADPGHVRVAEGSLRFVRPASVAILPAAMSAAGAAFGVISLFAPAWSGERFGLSGGAGPMALWAGAVGVASTVWLAMQLWALRLPTGLAVSAAGLDGVRGGADARVAWEMIDAVHAEPSGTGARLAITVTGGSVLALHAHEIGSDPNVVAAIIDHFLTHPEDREALSNARQAIRLVEAALA